MSGRVYLIGAGPGDPQLMTLKAARALGLADVVLVDALVHRGCLAYTRSDARIVEVGKRAGIGTSQAFIEKVMIQSARNGHTVARLKGGDPFVFGRGGEELQVLLAADLEVEVIPGITAGVGVPAMLGIPLTHRELSHGVTFVTGHGAEVDWEALVRSGTTLVIYMGLQKLESIKAALHAAGMDPRTPACVVENGTLPTQRHVITTLGSLSGFGFSGPALIVVGAVVALSKTAVQPKAKAA